MGHSLSPAIERGLPPHVSDHDDRETWKVSAMVERTKPNTREEGELTGEVDGMLSGGADAMKGLARDHTQWSLSRCIQQTPDHYPDRPSEPYHAAWVAAFKTSYYPSYDRGAADIAAYVDSLLADTPIGRAVLDDPTLIGKHRVLEVTLLRSTDDSILLYDPRPVGLTTASGMREKK